MKHRIPTSTLYIPSRFQSIEKNIVCTDTRFRSSSPEPVLEFLMMAFRGMVPRGSWIGDRDRHESASSEKSVLAMKGVDALR